MSVIAAVMALAAMPASAAVRSRSTRLDEIQAGQSGAPGATSNAGDNPAFAASSGSGTGFGNYDGVTHVFSQSFSVDGLSSPATLAHFHCGARGALRGPVRIERPSPDIGLPVGGAGLFATFALRSSTLTA